MRTDSDEAAPAARSHLRRWHLVGGIVAAVVVLSAGVVGYQRVRHVEQICAGVGLDGPEADSPEDALEAFFVRVERNSQVRIDRGAWHQTDTFGSRANQVDFESRDRAHPGVPGWLLSAFHRPEGKWNVGGACV